jgi:hypothetical protein
MLTMRSQALEVRKVAEKTPLLLVLYKHYLEDDVLTSGLEWLQNCFGSDDEHPVAVESTISEQHLLLRLLESNSKRVLCSFERPLESTEQIFSLSFLLPVATISSETAQNAMNSDLETFDACAVCGERTKSYCSGCHAIYYCTPGKFSQQHGGECRFVKASDQSTCQTRLERPQVSLSESIRRGMDRLAVQHEAER